MCEVFYFASIVTPAKIVKTFNSRDYMAVGVEPENWWDYPNSGGHQSITQVVVTPLPLVVRTHIKLGSTHLPGGKD